MCREGRMITFPGTFLFLSKSVFFTDQNDRNPVFVSGTSGDNGLAADTVRTLTVMTASCPGAWGTCSYPDSIRRCSDIANSADTILQSRGDLVHTCYYKYMRRPLDQTGYPVSISVYIDKFSVQSDGIGAGEKIV